MTLYRELLDLLPLILLADWVLALAVAALLSALD